MILSKITKTKPSNKRNYTDPHKPRYADFSILTPKDSLSDEHLKVVSYNIKYSKKIINAIKFIKSHNELNDAHVICLQEMTGDAVELIAHALGYNYVYYPAVFHNVLKKDFGNATLSRLPISSDEKVILPHLDPRHTQRTAVNTTIEFKNQHIFICNVHFKVLLKPSFRADQLQHLLKSFPRQASQLIIAGDFNTFTKANSKAILDPLMEHDFIPATDGLGWSHQHWSLLNKKSQLDHIFIKGLNIHKTGKVDNRTSSDHIPIWAQLSLVT